MLFKRNAARFAAQSFGWLTVIFDDQTSLEELGPTYGRLRDEPQIDWWQRYPRGNCFELRVFGSLQAKVLVFIAGLSSFHLRYALARPPDCEGLIFASAEASLSRSGLVCSPTNPRE